MLGLFLRALQIFSLGKLNFQHFLHAHSHFAFAGWGFLALAIALYHSFISDKTTASKQYNRIFIFGLIMAYGMLLSFPFTGYALVSISFSLLFILVSYWFGWRILKDLKAEKSKTSKSFVSTLFLKSAIFFLIISTLGALAMGPIMATGGAASALYFNSIYFYLHFQYNGWFMFGLFALFFKWLEQNDIYFDLKKATLFFNLFFGSAILSYLLSTLWVKPNLFIYWLAGLGALIQIGSVFPLWHSVQVSKQQLKDKLHPFNKVLGIGLFLAFLIKILMQLLSAFPLIVNWTVVFRSFVLGYLHLVLLGLFTVFLLIWFIQQNLLKINKGSKLGFFILILGFLITETLLFTEGTLMIFETHIRLFYRLMFYCTILLPLGTGILFLSQIWGRGKIK